METIIGFYTSANNASSKLNVTGWVIIGFVRWVCKNGDACLNNVGEHKKGPKYVDVRLN